MSGSMKCTIGILAALAGAAMAQPTLTSLGGGGPLGVTNSIGGTYYVGGSGVTSTAASRWSLNGSTLTLVTGPGTGGGYISKDDGAYIATGILNGPTRFAIGNTATGVSPAFTANPPGLTASATLPPATAFGGARWNIATNTLSNMGVVPIIPFTANPGVGNPGYIGNSGIYGPSSANGAAPDSSPFLTPNAISANGRFIVGLAYVCVYNAGSTAGTSISATSFYWRPVLWDAQGNSGAGSLTVLPTPFRTGTGAGVNTRRRTGNPYAVSNDGLVIVGATEHNVGTTPGLDVDGGRFCVWRWNSGTNSYDMTYLNTGVDGSGFPKYITSTPGTMAMNAAGTIIGARGPDGLTKWVWDGSSWGSPIVIGANLSTPASWLPVAVTSCGIPPTLGGIFAMSDDGNTMGGSVVYSTCGSFMSGGFIWHNGGPIVDWYDYNVDQGTPGCSTGGFWGPIGDNGNPAKGLPVLGNPNAISPDGTAIVGNQGGNQRIAGAPPWIWLASGGPTCVAPTITNNPTAGPTLISACSSSIILNVAASGTPPLTYQWYKDGNPLSDGGKYSGTTSFQFRVTPTTGTTLTPDDAGTYYAVVSGSCGSPVTSTNAVVSMDPAFPASTNDTCDHAKVVTAGTNVLTVAADQTICGAYVPDPILNSSCAASKMDRYFSFTPTTSGNYRIETCGSNFDTVVSIFDGCMGSELACNNDLNTGPTTSPTCSANRSRIASVALTANHTYIIRTAALASASITTFSSTLNLSILTAPAPAANDTCDHAIQAFIGANNFSTIEATNDYIAICNTTASRDVWFTFTPSTRGTLRASTCPGTAFNTVLSIYDSCGGAEIACNDDATVTGCASNLSTIANLPVAAVPYYIRVAGNSTTAFGAGVLNLDFICIADFNQDGGIDGSDVGAFFQVWEAGLPGADVNLDGGVDGSDVGAWFQLWEAGLC